MAENKIPRENHIEMDGKHSLSSCQKVELAITNQKSIWKLSISSDPNFQQC